MSTPERDTPPLRDRTITELASLIRCPAAHVGGGTAGAVAAGLGTATAALVVRLTAGRARHRDLRPEIEADLATLVDLERRLLKAGESDERALHELMTAYSAGHADDSDGLDDALAVAAGTSLEIARLAADVTEVVARQAPLASRFTVSDLGSAAALARGAAIAALMTARVNVALLRDRPAIDGELIQQFNQTIREIDLRSERLSTNAIETASEAIASRKGNSTS